jgi:hypothetical protein
MLLKMLLERDFKIEHPPAPFLSSKATRDQRIRLMKIQSHKCSNPYCNVDLRQTIPHLDHIIPRTRGGSDSLHNLQWLCEICNLNKGAKLWVVFLHEYARALGQDPRQNPKPWQKWVLVRQRNGLEARAQ